MSKTCKQGEWVEVHYVVLTPEERSPDVPEDTKKVPLECWVKGWALSSGTVGNPLKSGPRQTAVKGTLTRVNPGYTHSFGPSVPGSCQLARTEGYVKGG